MTTQTKTSTLDSFYDSLERIRVAESGVPDVGLLIAQSNYELEDLYPEGDFRVVEITDDTDEDSLFERLASPLEAGIWTLLVIATVDVPPKLYDVLRQIGSFGQADIPHFRGADEYVLRVHPDARIVVITTDDILETMSINTFLSIFGPIVRL